MYILRDNLVDILLCVENLYGYMMDEFNIKSVDVVMGQSTYKGGRESVNVTMLAEI